METPLPTGPTADLAHTKPDVGRLYRSWQWLKHNAIVVGLASLFVLFIFFLIGQFNSIRKEITAVERVVGEKVDGLRTELGDDVDGLRVDLESDIDVLRSDMKVEIGSLRLEARSAEQSLRAEVQTSRSELLTEIRALRD